MTKKNKEVTDFIIKYIDKIAPGGDNKNMWINLFKSMSDKEFDLFMGKLKSKETKLQVTVPAGYNKITVKRNIKIAKELGVDMFQHVKFVDDSTNEVFVTPNKYLIILLPVKRVSQLQTKGIAVPKDAASIDLLTGQVTGKSQVTRMTAPEAQLLIGMGLYKSAKELLKYRGGDLGGMNAMIDKLYKTGRVTQEDLKDHSTGVVSLTTLKNYLLGAHIKSTGLDNK